MLSLIHSLLSLQSVCFEARQLCGAPGVDPSGYDPSHPGLLCVQPPQSGTGDQTYAQIGASLTASPAAPLGHAQQASLENSEPTGPPAP